MAGILGFFTDAGGRTLASLAHNWPFLLASILIASALKAFVDTDRVAAFLRKVRGASVVVATGAAVATPFCSCGTMAVVLGMMATTMPMAPIVAFMIASPLSSPEELIYSAGLFGWPFAISYFIASILLGLGGGGIAAILEKRGWFQDQIRFTARDASIAEKPSCACEVAPSKDAAFLPVRSRQAPRLAPAAAFASAALEEGSCACDASAEMKKAGTTALPSRAKALFDAIVEVSLRLLPLFIGFAFLGYLLNGLLPQSWISGLFGAGHAYSVPLAATIGLPLYISSDASLPMVRAFLDSGMSQGAVMAFLIAGSGTSIGAITGALTIARWKVVGLVVAVLWVGAILAGYGFDALVGLGLAS